MTAMIVFLTGELLLWLIVFVQGCRAAASVPLAPVELEPHGQPASPPHRPLDITRGWKVHLPPGAGASHQPPITGTPEQVIATLLRQTRKENA